MWAARGSKTQYSIPERKELLAWHVVAQEAARLADVWQICVGCNRLQALGVGLREVMGHNMTRHRAEIQRPPLCVYGKKGRYWGGNLFVQAVLA